MDYTQAVAEARTLIKRSEVDQWRLAQLTWEQCRQNAVPTQQWADDVGMNVSYIRSLARLWERHQGGGARPPFAEAMREVHRPGEQAAAQEYGSTHAAMAHQTIRNLPPERKAEVVREALEDPEVARQTMSDPQTRSRTRTAIDHHDERQRELQNKPEPAREDRPDEEMVITLIDFRRVQRALSEITQRLQRSTLIRTNPDYRDAVLEQIAWDRNALGIIETLTNGGETTDEALARILEGGQL